MAEHGAICRLGVFYDGSFFSYAQNYYYHERELGWLRFPEFHLFLEKWIGLREQGFASYKVVYAAWHQGLFTSKDATHDQLKRDRNRHHDLMHAGVEPKYLPMSQTHGEKGVDVALAVDALQVGLGRMIDVAVLVTGDGDFVPLVRALNKQGVRVLAAYFAFDGLSERLGAVRLPGLGAPCALYVPVDARITSGVPIGPVERAMEIVRAEFFRLDEVPLSSVIGAVGVYVIWDGKAQSRPTYIGEGTILERVGQHASRFTRPFDGYLAMLGDWSTKQPKREAEILEAVLLAVASDTDRLPTQNRAPGKMREINRIFRSHGTLRIGVTGYDPLLIPGQARASTRAKTATVRYVADGLPYILEHDWRLRRLRS